MAKNTNSCHYLILGVVVLFALILVLSNSALAVMVKGGQCGTCGEWYEGSHSCGSSPTDQPPPDQPLPQKDRDQCLDIARSYLEVEEYDRAIGYLNKALESSPNDQEVLDWLRIAHVEKELDTALWYFRQNNWDKAIYYFNNALEYSPDDISILHSIQEVLAGKESEIGLKYFREGDFDKAEYHFKKALKHNPNDSDIADILRDTRHAKAFAMKNENDKRIEILTKQIVEKITSRLEGFVKQLQQNKLSLNTVLSSDVVDVRDKSWGPKLTRVISNNRKVAKIQKKRNKLVKEYWVFDQKISDEKDSIIRADLINKQTNIKSQIGVLDIRIMDHTE